jgi:LysM repeat protein
MTERTPGAPRLLKSALATSTLPLLVLGSAAMAAPAWADAPRQALAPRTATLTASVPTSFTGATTPTTAQVPATYTVASGDTLSEIAVRFSMGLSVLLKANGLSESSTIYPGQTLKLAGGASAAAPAAASATGTRSATGGTASGTHTVRAGDNLYRIAVQHGISLSSLLQANGLAKTSTIYPGQTLKLSGGASTAGTTGSVSTAATGSTASGTHTVRAGDNLYRIAVQHGISLSSLLQANGLSESSTIHPGQALKLSGTGAPAAAQDDLVPNTFLHYTYPDHIVRDANTNKRTLLSDGVPSRSQMQAIIADTARSMGVDPSLALAHAFTESSFNHASVSPANAIGAMQVIPSSGAWASELVGRDLDLMDPRDNAVAGVAIIRQLQRTAGSLDVGIAAYYQGLGGVQRNGMKPDTKDYVMKVKGYMQRF